MQSSMPKPIQYRLLVCGLRLKNHSYQCSKFSQTCNFADSMPCATGRENQVRHRFTGCHFRSHTFRSKSTQVRDPGARDALPCLPPHRFDLLAVHPQLSLSINPALRFFQPEGTWIGTNSMISTDACVSVVLVVCLRLPNNCRAAAFLDRKQHRRPRFPVLRPRLRKASPALLDTFKTNSGELLDSDTTPATHLLSLVHEGLFAHVCAILICQSTQQWTAENLGETNPDPWPASGRRAFAGSALHSAPWQSHFLFCVHSSVRLRQRRLP